MRRAKRDRGKPIPVGDLQQIAKFRAELGIYKKLRAEGKSHAEALRAVFSKGGGE
jgi:hypothetical protein